MNPVLIVGAGPTGLVLALSMTKFGVPIKIIDKADGPGTSSRAMAVMPRTLEFYNQLGISGAIINESIKIKEMQLHVDGKKRARMHVGSLGTGLSPFTSPYSFPQDEHEKLLLEKLNEFGITVDWNTELLSFQEDQKCVKAKMLQAGHALEEEFAYICGCDGAGSAVRHQINADFPGGTYEQLFYVMDIKATGRPIDSQRISLCFRGEEFVVLLPVRSKNTTRAIGIFPKQLVNSRDDVDKLVSFMEEAYQLDIKQVNWFSTYNVHHRVASHFTKCRAFLVGDAAHIHSPAGGQGMNTGIGDAVNLGWKLASVVHGKAKEELLHSYEVERRAFAERLVNTTDRAFTSVVSGSFINRLLRKQIVPRLIPLVDHSMRIKEQLFKIISQTQIEYTQSPLSSGKYMGVESGQRLPFTGDNYQTLQTMDWQVHVYGSASAQLLNFCKKRGLPLHTFSFDSIAEQKGLQKEAMYLLRPDGHIGLVHSYQDIQQLQEYLDNWGITPVHVKQ
ncbi:pentachlorophenol monooxygenase [Agaribacter marinus]|uniref:FAD-dependent monooxygenase n=1 Tax=Virgibacillus salarius TaxID=447199 RepID=A0A941DSQ8_9BACI|nr:FAD-dependent monooxygenase [Virgibacillus salarius]MBR7794697.1 FAD-dependent monooxygenase [Virgibacillus salarius]NAZ07417.1 pentachlorophenol monooxygenase [Agaribacter marinus]